nr:hypothetical protein GCM10020092_057160 [Actinoplanes digitatis]
MAMVRPKPPLPLGPMLGVDGDRSVGEGDLLLAGDELEGAVEAGGVAGGEELLGVGELAAGAAQLLGDGEVEVEDAVAGAGVAAAAVAGGGGGCRVHSLHGWFSLVGGGDCRAADAAEQVVELGEFVDAEVGGAGEPFR